MLVYTCILSGCDYLDSIKGVGFKTAVRLVQQHGTNLTAILQELARMKLDVDNAQYTSDFMKSFYTFKHHIVFDPISKRQTHLSPPLTDVNLEFVGKMQVDTVVCEALSRGEINPEL